MRLDTITELLNIQNYKAVEVTRDRYQNICITLEQIEDTLPVCSGCGKVHGTPVHSRDVAVVEDLRISGKRVFLLVTKRKAKCVEDNSIYS